MEINDKAEGSLIFGTNGRQYNERHRSDSKPLLTDVNRIPYDRYLGSNFDISLLEKLLSDRSSSIDMPAAVILETIQREDGLHTACSSWIKHIARIAQKFGALLIVDEIQADRALNGDFL